MLNLPASRISYEGKGKYLGDFVTISLLANHSYIILSSKVTNIIKTWMTGRLRYKWPHKNDLINYKTNKKRALLYTVRDILWRHHD